MWEARGTPEGCCVFDPSTKDISVSPRDVTWDECSAIQEELLDDGFVYWEVTVWPNEGVVRT